MPARQIADEILFPDAMAIDAAPVVPRNYLDVLADAGLYDLGTDPVAAARTIEALGGASLVTTFVWIQHHSVLRAVRSAGGALAAEWEERLRTGSTRAGIAYAALRRPGPPSAVATPAEEGWLLSGHAPWVTGWGLIDVVLAGARHGDDVVWLLLDASEAAGFEARPVELAALQASATVELTWTDVVVPAARVVAVEAFSDWATRDAHGRQTNGYLAVGVADRCARLLGPSPLDDQVAAARRALDESDSTTVTSARSAASVLAVRAAAALVASGGGRSIESDQHASRLMREATFLLVFGQTRDIRTAQVAALTQP